MAEESGARAAGLLVDQAWAAHRQGRYQEAVVAAGRAVEAAQQLDDLVLLVRALSAEAAALRLIGDISAALAQNTRILGLAQDPATRGRLDDPAAAAAVAGAHWNWVECARSVSGIPVRELFGVLDAAERWLDVTGHRDWRAAILIERAKTHRALGEPEAAIAAAEEALAVAVKHPDTPGYTLASYRYGLGDILRRAGRHAEAAALYHANLADPATRLWDQYAAHVGLAWCALGADDPSTARREAHTAALLAEALGDIALAASLEVLANALRAEGHLEDAWQAATRHLQVAGRIGGHHLLYYAVRAAVDVALDRADLPTARRLLSELDQHAKALDASTGTTTHTREAAHRHQTFADAEKASPLSLDAIATRSDFPHSGLTHGG